MENIERAGRGRKWNIVIRITRLLGGFDFFVL